MKALDEKLAKLGYHENSERSRRSHHKKAGAAASSAPAKPAAKPKEKYARDCQGFVTPGRGRGLETFRRAIKLIASGSPATLG
jgi:hypothetical protein